MPDCEPAFTTREELEFGVPIALNMIDVRAIGAGGGSLAYVDDAGMAVPQENNFLTASKSG